MKTLNVFILIFLSLVFVSCNDFFDNIFKTKQPAHERGTILWTHDLPGSDSLFILAPGNLYLAIAQGQNGIIYYGAGGGTLFWTPTRIFAVNEDDGSLKWRSAALDHMDLSSQIIVGDDGTIYAIGFYKLYAINPDDGTFKWVWEVPETVPHPDYPNGIFTHGQIGAMALTNNGDLVFGSIGNSVYSRGLFCVDKNGITKWYNLEANGVGIGTGLVIGENGNIFYYSSIAGKNYLLSVNSNLGIINWKKEIAYWGGAANNIVINQEGNLLCSFCELGSTEYHLVVVNPTDGTTLWTSNFLSTSYQKWIGSDGFYYHYLDKNVDKYGIYRISPQGANLTLANWDLTLSVIDSKNRFVHLFTDLEDFSKVKLGFFDIEGNLDWSVMVDYLRKEDFIISSNQVVYGVVGNSQIVAIQGDSELADSGWPKYGHDNRNTNNINKH